MLLSGWYLLAAGVILQGTAPAPKSWIADLKARRTALGNNGVRIEGNVVDIRSTSPTSRAGFYRLIDASDPEGVLIRTGKLPMDGGALRVRARIAPQQVAGTPLLLDELEQSRVDRRPIAPVVLVLVSLTSFVVLVVLLVRAYLEERRYKLTPPLWLLPDAGPYGKAAAAPAQGSPPLKYSPELEEADEIQLDQLQRRKRNLFHATIGSFGLTAASLAWVLVTVPASAQVPAFIFIQANDTPIPVAPSRPQADTAMVLAALDSLFRLMDPPEARAPAGQRRDSARAGTPELKNPFQGNQQGAVVGGAGQPRLGPENPAGPVALAPLPPPPPPPPPPTAPVVETAPPRDLEAERRFASEALGRAAGRLVDAVNAKRVSDLAMILPEALAGDLGRRERFMKLVRESSPRATLGAIETVTLADERGEARFSVQFNWRGDFGVQDRKTGSFLGLLRRDPAGGPGGGWRFEGARLLDQVP